MLLLAVPPPVFADELSGELPKSTRDILDEGGTDLSDAARWRFSDLCDTVGAWAAEGLQPALHLAAQSAGYLLLAGLLGLLAGDPYRAYVEILAVLGFGTLSLSAAMQLTELVAATAQDCRTYLTAFVPVFSGLAAAGGAIAMGVAVGKSTEGIARQPEAEGKIRTTLMLGLVFIETAIIYALLVVILIIFVL